MVHSAGAASVRSLAEQLNASESTIRRDLQELDRNGELARTYGGALSPARLARRPAEKPYALDAPRDLALKQSVALAAAALVREGDVVILDIGTTTPLLARELRGREVTVITSNLGVLDELRADEAVRLVVLGGVVRRNYQSLVGSLVELGLGHTHADAVFLSCTGVRPNGRVVDDMAIESPVKHAMIEAAEQVVLLATERKFPGSGSLRVCSLSEVTTLVTTGGADAATVQLCRDAGGKVITT